MCALRHTCWRVGEGGGEEEGERLRSTLGVVSKRKVRGRQREVSLSFMSAD